MCILYKYVCEILKIIIILISIFFAEILYLLLDYDIQYIVCIHCVYVAAASNYIVATMTSCFSSNDQRNALKLKVRACIYIIYEVR